MIIRRLEAGESCVIKLWMRIQTAMLKRPTIYVSPTINQDLVRLFRDIFVPLVLVEGAAHMRVVIDEDQYRCNTHPP